MNQKIEILCVGAQKAGTTSLHNILKNHPQIELPYIKEIYYFSDDKEYRSLSNLHRHYSFEAGKVAMNITPSNMCNDLAIQRIYEYNPNMKIIMLLRNPTNRVISQYRMRYRNFNEKRSLSEVISDEIDSRIFEKRACSSLLYRSMYSQQIKHIQSFFPKEQLYYVLFEEFSKNQKRVIDDLLNWCQLPVFDFEHVHSNEKFNGSKNILWRIATKIPHKLVLRIQEIFKVNLRQLVKSHVKKDMIQPLIDEATVLRLQYFFKETIDETERLTGLNLDIWRNSTSKTGDKHASKSI
ncbi:MAG: sulfotransferase [Erysipelothrix sp.]|jgi:hypothetical protein|nr:sulfotransferase [Erysipelothrix sp.]